MSPRSPLRILLVEDDDGYAFLVREVLAEQGPETAVDRAATLGEALDVLERGEHDCVLLDLGLPDADGVDGVRRLCERHPHVPVVVLTGHDDDAVADATLAVGAQDFVVKGSEPSLRRAVRNATARAAAESRLHDSEERYRSIVRGLPGFGVMAFDDRLRMTHVEGEAMVEEGHRLSYPGQPAEELLAPETFAATAPLFRRALAGERFSVDLTSSRRERTFVVHFSPVRDAHGRVTGGVALGIDVSEQRQAEAALAASELRHRALAQGVPVGIFEIDLQGACRYVNERYCDICGLTTEEALGDGWREHLHPDDVEPLVAEWTAAMTENREFRLDYRMIRPDGSHVWVTGRATELVDEAGARIAFLGTISDITARRRAEERLREATGRFSAAFEHAPLGMGIIGMDGAYEQVNPAVCSLLGRTADELVGRRPEDFVHTSESGMSAQAVAALVRGESDEWETERCFVRPDGQPVWAWLHATVVRDAEGLPLQVFVQMLDIGDRRRHEADLRHLADHDALTGLLNRRRFEEEAERHVAEVARYGGRGALLLLDLDGFKTVNDTLGHQAGDRLLSAVASALRLRMRSTDVVGRLGGDEFAVLVPHGGEDTAREIAAVLEDAVAGAGASVSIGVAVLDGRDASAEEALGRADAAMYEVKQARAW
jgi:diguanylate cyclase (GGDEF)-like protein/PAS domain S-box-containing protein